MTHLRLRHGSDHNHSPDTSAAKREREAALKRRRQQYQRTLSEQTQAIHQAQRDQWLRRKQERYKGVGDKEPQLPEGPKRPRHLEDRKKTKKKSSKTLSKVALETPRQMTRKRKHQQQCPEECKVQPPHQEQEGRHGTSSEATMAHQRRMPGFYNTRRPETSEAEYKWQENLKRKRRKHRKELDIRAQVRCPEQQQDQRDQQLRRRKLDNPEEASDKLPGTKHSPSTSVPRDLAEPQAPKLHHGTQTLEEAAKAPSRRDTSQQTNYRVAELDQEIVQVSKDSKPALSTAKQQRVAERSPKDQKCGRRRGALEEPQAKGHGAEPRPGGGSMLAEGQRPAQPGHHTISSPTTATRGECPPAAE